MYRSARSYSGLSQNYRGGTVQLRRPDPACVRRGWNFDRVRNSRGRGAPSGPEATRCGIECAVPVTPKGPTNSSLLWPAFLQGARSIQLLTLTGTLNSFRERFHFGMLNEGQPFPRMIHSRHEWMMLTLICISSLFLECVSSPAVRPRFRNMTRPGCGETGCTVLRVETEDPRRG